MKVRVTTHPQQDLAMINTTRETLSDFVALFFPRYCLGCGQVLLRQEVWLCTMCFADLPQTHYHLHNSNPIIQKLYGKVPVTYAMALYKFRAGNLVQHLIHQLKYENQPAIGEFVGRIYGAQLAHRQWESQFDCIIPVPLHEDRLRQRGYNQSDYFAQGMADLLKIPWYGHCVQRIKNTNTQTKKSKLERLQNLLASFVIADTRPIQNKHILLVDDVLTTGATLEACALPLLSAGASEVSVATICIAD